MGHSPQGRKESDMTDRLNNNGCDTLMPPPLPLNSQFLVSGHLQTDFFFFGHATGMWDLSSLTRD